MEPNGIVLVSKLIELRNSLGVMWILGILEGSNLNFLLDTNNDEAKIFFSIYVHFPQLSTIYNIHSSHRIRFPMKFVTVYISPIFTT